MHLPTCLHTFETTALKIWTFVLFKNSKSVTESLEYSLG